MTTTFTEEIDRLLERYLHRLDQYTRLREELGRAHAATLQNIARANFEGERGRRFGADSYDERMQALCRCRVGVGPDDVPIYSISSSGQENGEISMEGKETQQQDGIGGTPNNEVNKESALALFEEGEHIEQDTGHAPSITSTKTSASLVDPIRMFGVLSPPSLRLAQTEAIKTVENIVPKLVSADAALKDLEIQIRRAKKYRAKAESNGGKQITAP